MLDVSNLHNIMVYQKKRTSVSLGLQPVNVDYRGTAQLGSSKGESIPWNVSNIAKSF